MTDRTQAQHTPAATLALPPGYRLSETASGILGPMWTGYDPKGKDIGACGGGSGRNAGKQNQRRAAAMCFEDYGRQCAKALAGINPEAVPMLVDLAQALVTAYGDTVLPTHLEKHLLDGARAALAKASGVTK